MGTIIRSTGISIDESISSSIDNGCNAAENCLAAASIDRQDIDLLINVGVYRDSNIFEPSIAILMQKKLGISLGYSQKKHVLSFDLTNGNCGLLNAAQSVDAIFKNSNMRRALIISSDAHPSSLKVSDFPYNHVGAAMLLEWSDDAEKGFQNFSFRTTSSEIKGVDAYVDTKSYGDKGRQNIKVTVDKNYADELVPFTVKCIKEYMDGVLENKDIKDVKLLTTQPTHDFTSRIAEALGLGSTLGDSMYAKYGDTHTSSLCITYHEAVKNGLVRKSDRLLFCAAGAGLTAGTVLYKS